MPYGSRQEIIESAATVARLSAAMFGELYALNEQIILGKTESKRTVHV